MTPKAALYARNNGTKLAQRAAMSSRLAILVVDDEESICAACRRVLTADGFRVDCSTDPAEGLRLAARRSYAAIVLDLRMPGLDGLTWLERLRTGKPTLPVIVITGYPSAESASQCVRLGARAYIQKPFTPEQIRDAVHEGPSRPR